MNNICKEYSKCGEGVFISSDKGWIPVEYVMKTVPFEKYIVLFESGNELECADRHALINKNHNTITADELKIGDEIICEYGIDKVFDVFATGQYEEMYDVSLKDYHHYYANGILSHNSTFLANLCARQVMMGKNIVLASLEMSEDAFSQRFDSIFSLLDINRIYREKSMKLKLIKKLGELKAQEGRGNLYIKQYPTGKATVDDYRRYIRELRIRGIVIHEFVCDYLNLMKSQYKTKGDMYSDVKNISEELRAMSYEFKIPVVSVSQLNREGMNITFDEVDFTYISECLSLDTDVLMWDGKTYKNEKICNLRKGDIIKGSDDNVSVSRIFNKKIKKMYKIKTKSGKEIICSADHKFPTSDGFKNIKTGLKVGDFLSSL